MELFKIDKLLGNYIDFDQEYYDFWLKKLENGVIFKNFNSDLTGEHLMSSLNSMLNFHSKPCIKKSIVSFNYNPFFKDDLVNFEKTKDLTKITLVKKGTTRLNLERSSFIWEDSFFKINEIKKEIVNRLKILDETKINIDDVIYLKKFGLASEDNFSLRPGKTKKGTLNFKLKEKLKDYIEELNKTNLLPINFQSIQATEYFYLFSNKTFTKSEIDEFEHQMEKNYKSNLDFWSQDIINYNSYLLKVDLYF